MQRSIKVGARDSQLSRKQVEEVFSLLEVAYEPVWMHTRGDRDQVTSLRTQERTNFFTQEIDEALLADAFRVAIHSAKDLPDPLPEGLELIALTKGVDPSDSLVLREGEQLRSGMVVGTSSFRREENVSRMQEGVQFVDIRGTIRQRLDHLYQRKIDGVVIAEAALIRLGLIHLNRFTLPGETSPLQGRLAVIARAGDEAMRHLFAPIHHEEYSLSRA